MSCSGLREDWSKAKTYESYGDDVMKLASFLTGYMEHRKYPRWKGFLPFYRKKCKIHGVYVDYLHGYKEYFQCPKCGDERK